jgi:thiol-disulfide isomerase/thioredoxin
MNRIRVALGAALIVCSWTAVGSSAQGGDTAPDLTAAKQAFERNVALGESLAGKPATTEQAADAQRLFDEALTKARAAISAESRSADAHRLAGMVLCTAYRPVVVQQSGQSQGDEKAEPSVTVLLRGAGPDCEEGLAELRSALRLSRSAPDYALDYADAMLACGDAKGAQEQAAAVWDRRSSLSRKESVRPARLLASCAQASNLPEMEAIWLRQVLKLDPTDQAAGQRLAKLVGSRPGIAWMPYEAGVALASQTNKPMLIDFTATWCGWCKKLEQDVFSNKDMIALSQRFVCIRVDGDGRTDLTSRFGVDGYPTTLVLGSSGGELHRAVGYMPLAKYVAEVKQALPPG